MMKKITLVLLLCISVINLYSQNTPIKEYKLEVNLKGALFNSLALLDYREHHNVIIKGERIGQFKWKFKIPDSIVSNSENMMLIIPEKDTINNAFHQVRFFNKKTSIVNIGIQDEFNFIEATFENQVLYKNTKISDFLGITDTIINGNIINNDFKLSIRNNKSDIAIRAIDPYYSWFYNDFGIKDFSYKDYLLSYIKLAKKYPNSRYLITNLALNLSSYKSRKDVENIYQNLSDKFKNTKWGKQINSFLSDRIQDISFINLALNVEEAILPDTTKFKLLIFSASWCAPCIEEIPLLKELDKNLHKSVQFIYISMDDKRSIKNFEKVLKENKISWLTLYAYHQLERVKNFFSIKGIPYTLLLYPNGKMEIVDVRDKEISNKLPSLVTHYHY